MFIFLVILFVLFGHFNAADLYIYEPTQNAQFLTEPTLFSSSSTIEIHFDIFNTQDSSQIQVCIDLIEINTLQIVLKSTCTSMNQFKLQNIPPGKYKINFILKDLNGDLAENENKIERLFSVVSFENEVPTVKFSNQHDNHLYISVTKNSTTSNVNIQYSLTKSSIPLNKFQVCISSQLLSRRTCFPSSEKQLFLSNLPLGNHLIYFDIVLAQNTSHIFTRAQQELHIHIDKLENMLPIIDFEQNIFDYGVSTPKDSIQVAIPFILNGYLSTIQQVQVCIEVVQQYQQDYNNDDNNKQILVPFSCLDSNLRALHLSNMLYGQYDILFYLRENDISQPQQQPPSQYVYEQSKSIVSVDIRIFEEIIPTYDWQPLLAWHTIPSGLETRLPLSTLSRKEARIPQPWQLQLTMPYPCSYFLRINIYRNTTIQEVLDAASNKCLKSVDYFTLHEKINIPIHDGKEHLSTRLDFSDTAESSDLFNKVVELHFDEQEL